MSDVQFEFPKPDPHLRALLRRAIVGVCHAYRAQILEEIRSLANRIDGSPGGRLQAAHWCDVCEIIERIEPHV